MSTRTFTGAAALGVAALALTHSPARGQAAGAVTPTAPLTLPSAVGLALSSNPAALAAAQQFAQYQARVTQAEAGRRFQITFNSSTSGTDATFFQPPPRRQLSYTTQNTVTVPLPIGARPGLLLRQAQDQLESGRALYDAARAGIAVQVGTAYFDLLRKQALLLVAQDTLAQAQRQLTEATRRNQAGDVPQLDVLRAQVPVASAQAQLLVATNDVAVAGEALNSLIGQPLDTPLAVADVRPDAALQTTLTLPQVRTQALAFSPDVRAAEATVRADEAALQSARLFHEPVLSIQAADARSNDQTGFSRADTLLASVTVPLSDGGLGRAQVREAEAALAQAQAQVEVARRSILAAVSGAFLTAQSARGQVTAAQSARDIAQVSYDKTEQGYRSGLFPLTDVLNAQAALTQARIAYTQAVYGAAASANSLTAALNGGLVTNTTGPATGPAIAPAPAPPGPGGTGTSPGGAATPGASPAGTTTTGTNPGGANAGGAGAAGRGGP